MYKYVCIYIHYNCCWVFMRLPKLKCQLMDFTVASRTYEGLNSPTLVNSYICMPVQQCMYMYSYNFIIHLYIQSMFVCIGLNLVSCFCKRQFCHSLYVCLCTAANCYNEVKYIVDSYQGGHFVHVKKSLVVLSASEKRLNFFQLHTIRFRKNK